MEVKELQGRLEIIRDVLCEKENKLVDKALSNYETYSYYVDKIYNMLLGCSMLLTASLNKIDKVKGILLEGKEKYPKAECNDKVDELLFRIGFAQEQEAKRDVCERKQELCQDALLRKFGIGYSDYNGPLSNVISNMIEAAQIYRNHQLEPTHTLRDRLEIMGDRKPDPKDGIAYLCHNIYFVYFVNCMVDYSDELDETFLGDSINIMFASRGHDIIQTSSEKAHYNKTVKMACKKITAYSKAKAKKAKTLKLTNAA